MKYLPLFTLSLVLFCSLNVVSQTVSPTPPDEDVVKISTNLIQIDVTVTDKNGNVVTNLKPEDFEIYENGKSRDISNFSFVDLLTRQDDAAKIVENKNKQSAPVPSVKLSPEKVRRTYAIAIDDLGLSFSSMFFVKEAVKKFVNEQMQDGDLVAIIRTSGGIGALQSFTSDKRLLLAAAEKIRWNSQSRVGINSFEPFRESLKESLQGTKKLDGTTLDFSKEIEMENSSENDIASFRNQSFATGSLGALRYLIRGMEELPGRKAIIFLSEGFQIFSPDGISSGIGSPNQIADTMRLLADQANRASVVFYTLDPRGLDAPTATAADQITNIFDANTIAKMGDRENYFRNTQDSLRYLAYETGGFPFLNQNNILYGLKKASDDQRGYYLVAYQPEEETFDPQKTRFNKLTIKVKRPDLKVRYRSGFFGVSEEKIAERDKQSNPQIQLTNALVSPFGTSEIDLDVYSAFYRDEHKQRDFLRTLIYINPKDLKFSVNAKNLYESEFDIITAIFDANGAAATNSINTHTLQFTKERLASLQEKGIIYDLPVPVIKKGAYQFRVALRDKATGKIGAASQFVEIPDLDKKRLTVSNLVVRNYSIPEWRKVSLEPNALFSSTNTHLADTVKREFKKGSVMTYFCEIYNAKIKNGQSPQLLLQTKLFREGKMLMESDIAPIKTPDGEIQQSVPIFNSITLGTDLQAGDYALQVIVYDKLANGKKKLAYQSIDFEVVD